MFRNGVLVETSAHGRKPKGTRAWEWESEPSILGNFITSLKMWYWILMREYYELKVLRPLLTLLHWEVRFPAHSWGMQSSQRKHHWHRTWFNSRKHFSIYPCKHELGVEYKIPVCLYWEDGRVLEVSMISLQCNRAFKADVSRAGCVCTLYNNKKEIMEMNSRTPVLRIVGRMDRDLLYMNSLITTSF